MITLSQHPSGRGVWRPAGQTPSGYRPSLGVRAHVCDDDKHGSPYDRVGDLVPIRAGGQERAPGQRVLRQGECAVLRANHRGRCIFSGLCPEAGFLPQPMRRVPHPGFTRRTCRFSRVDAHLVSPSHLFCRTSQARCFATDSAGEGADPHAVSETRFRGLTELTQSDADDGMNRRADAEAPSRYCSFFSAASAEPVRPARSLRLRAVHRREQGQVHPSGSGGAQGGKSTL